MEFLFTESLDGGGSTSDGFDPDFLQSQEWFLRLKDVARECVRIRRVLDLMEKVLDCEF